MENFLSLTHNQLSERLSSAFSDAQTTVLADMLDGLRQVQVERANDSRELQRGLNSVTDKLNLVTDRLDRLTEIVGQLGESQQNLAVAQQRTEQRLNRLSDSVEQLAQAQQRTEQHVEQLAQAQQRTEQRLDQLTVRMEAGFTKLTRGLDELRVQVGAMVNAFGFSLEDFVGDLLPAYLEIHNQITGLTMARRYFPVNGGLPEEIDLFGVGERNGEPLTVVAEVTVSAGGGKVRQFASKLPLIAAQLEHPNLQPVLVAMNVHPTAREAAEQAGILIIPYRDVERRSY